MNDEPIPWMSEAACANVAPELWFPGEHDPQTPALRICSTRPVIAACRDYAVSAGIRDGTWGGLSQQGLRRIYTATHRT